MVDLTRRPVTASLHGLATEDSGQAIEPSRLPLHAALGVGCPPANIDGRPGHSVGPETSREAQRLIELISDLLDMALHESSATAC